VIVSLSLSLSLSFFVTVTYIDVDKNEEWDPIPAVIISLLTNKGERAPRKSIALILTVEVRHISENHLDYSKKEHNKVNHCKLLKREGEEEEVISFSYI
jgi:hypothetical protein